jgi:metal-responsive CopG/Arc/MetJ family transcriptional regulator
MSAKIFNLSMPSELFKVMEEQAKLNYTTRSEYIKAAVIARLKLEGAFNETLKRTFQSAEEANKAKLKEFLKEYELNGVNMYREDDEGEDNEENSV